MRLYLRLAITVAAMLVTSFVAGSVWREIFGMRIPSYLSGMIGGLSCLPIWEFLRRYRSKEKK